MHSSIFLTFVSLVFSFVQADVYESTHLVTMRKAEFMEIIDCVSKSMNPVLCKKFEECQKFLPQQVVIATNKCKKECMVGGVKKCSHHEPLFESPEVPYKRRNTMIFWVIQNTSYEDFLLNRLHHGSIPRITKSVKIKYSFLDMAFMFDCVVENTHKIFDCVVENTHKLNAEESKMMVEYEKCIRDFHVKSCKFPKHHEEFHDEYLDGFH